MKAFIESNFRVVDLNGDGVISADEFRYDCVLRIPVLELDSIDEAYNNLLEVSKLQYLFSKLQKNIRVIFIREKNAISER